MCRHAPLTTQSAYSNSWFKGWARLDAFALSSIFTLIFPCIAAALTFAPISMDKAVRGAELIVFATVTQQNTQTVDGRLMTMNTLRVHQAIKGTPPKEITVIQSGGQQKGITMTIPGAPQLKLGQQWVLMLRPKKSKKDPQKSLWIITGGTHGARMIVRRDTDGILVLQPQSSRSKLFRLKKTPQKVSTFRLKKSVRDQAKVVSPPASPVVTLEQYIDRLKVSVDRSQAPLSPTH